MSEVYEIRAPHFDTPTLAAFDYHLRCPVCKGIANHPVRVEVEPVGNKDTPPQGDSDHYNHLDCVAVTHKGVEVSKANPKAPLSRGVTCTTMFRCEVGHTWYLDLEFHKGFSFFSYRTGEDWDKSKDIETIWRD